MAGAAAVDVVVVQMDKLQHHDELAVGVAAVAGVVDAAVVVVAAVVVAVEQLMEHALCFG